MNRLNLAALLTLTASTSLAGDWRDWRGPTSNGVAPAGNWPVKWSATENIAWKLTMEGRGASTPVVTQDRIFVTFGRKDKNVLQCISQDGKKLWDVEIGTEVPGKHNKASGANPSAVTDGKHVFAYFKSGDLCCVTLDGEIVWQKNLQEHYGTDTLWWDLGTSPVLTKNDVVIACMHSGPSYVAAFSKKTGKVTWKTDRDLNAPLEAAQSYSTPLVVKDGDHERVYVLGADHVTAHDGADGRELWRVGGLNPDSQKFFRSISGPVIADGVLLAPYARGNTVTAIRLGGKGDVTKSHVLWTRKGMGADVPTPIALDGVFYFCRDRGNVARLSLETGSTLEQTNLPKSRRGYSSSPILANDRLYVTREDGTSFVLDTKDKLKVLSENPLDEHTVATPVFVNDRILIRTFETLYCIGAKKG